jgi:hypothetical protein
MHAARSAGALVLRAVPGLLFQRQAAPPKTGLHATIFPAYDAMNGATNSARR